GGSGTVVGSYGTLGDWNTANIPPGRLGAAGWTDQNGNFWLFGGGTLNALFSDLWEFNPSIDEWAWIGGSTSYGQPGVYGSLGSSAAGNVPGARLFATTWSDSNGNLWLFGGLGYDAQGTHGYLNDLWQYSLKGTPAVLPPSAAAIPSFSLASGTYASAQTLTISDQTPGAVIYYTTNGTMPNGSSTVYSGQITVSSSETVAAIAVASSYSVSAVATATYALILPTAATPTFSVPGGTYTATQTLTISDATAGAAIYYTTNGTTPTTSSTVYGSAITVSATETIEAIAVASGYTNSTVESSVYTINLSPTFSLAASPSSLTAYSGNQGLTTLTVTPQYGFSSTVSFRCSGLPANASCTFSPTTVTPSGAAATTQLTIAVGAQAMTVRPRPGPLSPATALAAVVCIFAFRRRRAVQFGLALAVVFAGLALLSSCGGGGSGGAGGGGGGGGGTTPVTSTVTVTATSGSIQQNATVTLTVN
ncbi:MAG: chitobiase/beta-hexosaminidase C-terminal domain-containing protein, partial [Terracidiphilus sp.]